MKRLLVIVSILCLILTSQATTVSSTAGGLSSAIKSIPSTILREVTNLTITGSIDTRDFAMMRDSMRRLSVIDMSGASIVSYNGYSKDTIPTNAFYNPTTDVGKTSLTSIILPLSATTIGVNAFEWCTNLTSVSIPTSVTAIENGAFFECTALTSITIPASVTSIGTYAFGWCDNLTSIYAYPTSPIDLSTSPSVFYNIDQTTCTLHVPIASLDLYKAANQWQDFSKFALILNPISKTINITAGGFINALTSIEFSTITNLTITGTMDARDFAYMRDSMPLLSTLDLSGVSILAYSGTDGTESDSSVVYSANTIPQSAFWNQKTSVGEPYLSSIKMPSSLTSIGDEAFQWCGALTSITIPSSVSSIGNSAFNGCAQLSSIYDLSTNPVDLSSSTNVFSGVNTNTCILYVPTNSASLYEIANQWENFFYITEMVFTGLVSQTIQKVVIFYPNPAIDGFTIDGLEGTGTLTILDLNAKTLLTKQVTGNEYVSISSFPKGLYVVKISTNGKIIEDKIIKE
jgi:hypothetical protein